MAARTPRPFRTGGWGRRWVPPAGPTRQRLQAGAGAGGAAGSAAGPLLGRAGRKGGGAGAGPRIGPGGGSPLFFCFKRRQFLLNFLSCNKNKYKHQQTNQTKINAAA